MGRQIEQAAAERFIELYGHLLAYVNAEYGIVDGIETRPPRTDSWFSRPTGAVVPGFQAVR